jgi:radical SAM-linked protein
VRKSGFTLAPEAGTQRLRDVIQKEYREEELLDAARLFADLGWRTLKLYFMIGLPSETEDDVRGIAELSGRVAAAASGRLTVTASVSTFSPKPHTPFQWAGQLTMEETRVRQALLRHELARRRIEFRWHDARLSFLEGVFARGDRRLADVLLTAQRAGARFDGWSDRCNLELWTAAFAAHGIDPVHYLRRRPLDETLPWDHLDAGLSTRFLRQDLARAVQGVLTPDCSIERCTYCGACDFEAVRNVDYHPEGAKGGDHRGAGAVSRWAELLVPPADDGPLPAWETRMYREIRTRVAERRQAARAAAPVTEAPATIPLSAPAADGGGSGGDGNAEEWLGAVPSNLTPEVPTPPPVQRIRLRYRKVGPARFIGTRELGSVFLRAARRAGLPLAFSQGHHPLPRLSFGPALPLGFSSDDEYVDVDLTRTLAPEVLVADLGAEMPEGLDLVAATTVSRSAPSIDAGIAALVYEVDLASLDAPPPPAAAAAAVAHFAAAPALPVPKRSKAGTRTVDARRFVHALELVGPQRLRLELAVGPEGTLKPAALLGALLPLGPDDLAVLRVHKIATRFHESGAGGLAP